MNRVVGSSARIAAVAVCCMLGTGVTVADTVYMYDDGVSNVLLGPPSSFAPYGNIDVLVGNYFYTEEPQELLNEVQFGLGDLSEGNEVSVWIFNDVDNDGDPTNAVPLVEVQTIGENLGFDFNVLSIPPTVVEGGFFVGVEHYSLLTYDDENNPGYSHPGRFDPDARADRSWFFYDDDIPENDLASSGFVQRMDGPYVPIPGAFAIRATTTVVPEPGSLMLLLGGASMLRRRRSVR